MQLRQTLQKDLQITLPKKIIIDTHGGAQDFLSIIAAQRILQRNNSDAQIIGIVCTHGKNSIEQSCKYALAANNLLKTKIPIYRGQNQSFIKRNSFPQSFNDLDMIETEKWILKNCVSQEDSSLIKPQKGVDFLIKSIKEYGKQLAVVTFGPLTTLAMAYLFDNSIKESLGMISIFGGQYLGIGDTLEDLVQQNFAFDPYAAAVIISHLGEKVYLHPRDKTFNCCWKELFLDLEGVGEQEKKIIKQINTFEFEYLFFGEFLTIAPVLIPKAVTKQYHLYGEIVLDSGNSDGLLAINWLRLGVKENECLPSIHIYEGQDIELIKKRLNQAFKQKIE